MPTNWCRAFHVGDGRPRPLVLGQIAIGVVGHGRLIPRGELIGGIVGPGVLAGGKPLRAHVRPQSCDSRGIILIRQGA